MAIPNPSIIPSFRYRDAPRAIDFLVEAFGFEKHLIVPDEEDRIAHAQLILPGKTGMIMLGSARDDEWGRYMKPAGQLGMNTCSPYVIVDDVDRHCETARKAGAEIIIEPHDEEYGGRGYACKDLEGHIWYFGTYNPFVEG